MEKKLFFISILWIHCLHINGSENQDKQYKTKELLNTNQNKEIKQIVLYKKESTNLLFFLYNDDYKIHALDLKNDNELPAYKSCNITSASIKITWELGQKKEIYHLAEPYDYKAKTVLPIANKKNVFLAEILNNKKFRFIRFNAFRHIITHNTDIYKLYSSGESIISTSIYPSIKVWQRSKEIEKNKKLSYVGGLCLGSNSNQDFFYMIKDNYGITIFNKWDRWRNRNSKTINGLLYGFTIDFDNEGNELKLNEIESQNKLSFNLSLNGQQNILFATYNKNKKNSKNITIDGMLLANNNFYLCGFGQQNNTLYFKQITLPEESQVKVNIKQMFLFTNPGNDKNNNFYLLTMSDTDITIYLLVNSQQKTLLENNINENTEMQLKIVSQINVQAINMQKYQKITLAPDTKSVYIATTNEKNETILSKIENIVDLL
ncbi:hypothetical protein EKK58_10870 [Candidatus Dependentiae bacterium]|nr:MAG: hypothetical protein EKK58_10870 [Candidatus Dependentiae bacterium]